MRTMYERLLSKTQCNIIHIYTQCIYCVVVECGLYWQTNKVTNKASFFFTTFMFCLGICFKYVSMVQALFSIEL